MRDFERGSVERKSARRRRQISSRTRNAPAVKVPISPNTPCERVSEATDGHAVPLRPVRTVLLRDSTCIRWARRICSKNLVRDCARSRSRSLLMRARCTERSRIKSRPGRVTRPSTDAHMQRRAFAAGELSCNVAVLADDGDEDGRRWRATASPHPTPSLRSRAACDAWRPAKSAAAFTRERRARARHSTRSDSHQRSGVSAPIGLRYSVADPQGVTLTSSPGFGVNGTRATSVAAE